MMVKRMLVTGMAFVIKTIQKQLSQPTKQIANHTFLNECMRMSTLS